jgi:hypothetical protein
MVPDMKMFPIFTRLSMLGILAASLTSCLSMPITIDNVLMVEVAAPVSASDLATGRTLIDTFALQHGYANRPEVNAVSDAGEGYVKAFNYSGKLKTVRAYRLSTTSESAFPYLIDLLQGDDGRLFFNFTLPSHSSEGAVKVFVQQVVSTYGKDRVHIAEPTDTEWISIGD